MEDNQDYVALTKEHVHC
jgi:hypothetical protein